jgi:hypothetical protein
LLRTLVALAAALAVTLLAAPAASAAPAETETRDYTVDLQSSQTCNGDYVATKGTRRTIVKPNNDGTTTLHYNYQGTGIGQPSGAAYSVVINEKFTFPGLEFTDHFRMRVISKGGEQNLLVAYRFKDGQVELDSARCVG